MKRPHQHLLRVTAEAASFGSLIAAAREEGLRIGWLRLDDVAPPPSLGTPADAGALRAVSVGGGRTVAVKTMRGAPVMRDLMREHFRGCALVLVTGDGPLAEGLGTLTSVGGAWQVRPAAAGAVAEVQLTTAEMVAALRRPRPW